MKNPTIRYAVLPANTIFNWLAPKNVTMWNAFHRWHDTWWSDETMALREKCGQMWIEEFDKQTNHFSELEKSVLRDGIKHPVKVVTGPPFEQTMSKRFPDEVIPPDMRTNMTRVLSSHQFGGSRLYVAQKYNLPVPCLIYDYFDSFPEYNAINLDALALQYRGYYRSHTYDNGIKTLVVSKHLHLPSGGNPVPRHEQSDAINKVIRYVEEIERSE